MRQPWRVVLRALAVVAATLAVSAPAWAEFSASVSFFYDDLAPYGRWVTISGYGDCWHPYHVRARWRPYLDGRWAYTDAGWTWVADEAWGWAPYHYGRWMLDPEYGWVWVPGDQWAPAWVSWYYGDGYVGWAPLPPDAHWVAGVGLDLGAADIRQEMGPRWYTFVPETRFVDFPVQRYAAPLTRNPELSRIARPYTDYAVVGGAVVDRGVPVRTIERVTRRPVLALRLRAAATMPGHASITGHEVRVYRPVAHVTFEAAVRRQELGPMPPWQQRRVGSGEWRARGRGRAMRARQEVVGQSGRSRLQVAPPTRAVGHAAERRRMPTGSRPPQVRHAQGRREGRTGPHAG